MAPEGMVIADDAPFTEEDVLRHLPRWRWLKIGSGKCTLIAMNWVVTALASAMLLTFIIIGAVPESRTTMINEFKVKGQPWITQNFTWLYIATQDVWVIFLVWLACSKYGKLKLGKDNELPRYNDMTWFCMLFCCGIAVGFFLFGVGEPLYYYRQPTYWKGWDYDYNLHKIQGGSVVDDDLRANQSIFMCYFHWGIHGWIPYVLIAVNVGIVSHRWGLPITIRACFYPLIGDHIFSFVGDLIDSVSMACTTFGVCTSLGLGAMQLTAGLVYMQKEFTELSDLAGLSAIKADKDTYSGLIIGITTVSALSVASGLNRGLKYLSMLAMAICLFILFFCLMADNTAYLMNIFVQNVGFYIQYVIQIGFDCEAFEQLAYELSSGSDNLLWGSSQRDLARRIGDAVNSGTVKTFVGADCGSQVNPCTAGTITSEFWSYETGAVEGGALAQFGVSAASIAAGAAYIAANVGTKSVPCGTATVAPHAVLCPTTTFDNAAAWGSCTTYKYKKCTAFQAKYDSTSRFFMDFWTVFYWGWWVSWGPFVGVFVATISRGRTIRNVVVGAFVLPTAFCALWFGVFGGLAIKNQRVTEFALDIKPDFKHGLVDCDNDYSSSGVPTSANAIALDAIGYRMLACQPFVTQIYDVMQPYGDYKPFLWLLLWCGLFFYFITSSDSGSFVDDMLGASGLSHPPIIQKIYWCVTEGLVAIVLVTSADNISAVLKGLRSVSICSGFPLTIMMCSMCPAVWRAVKRESGEKDILESKRFNTQIWDFAVGFRPANGTGPYHGKCMTYLVKIALGVTVPGWAVFRSLSKIPGHKCAAVLMSLSCQALYTGWFIFHIIQVSAKDSHAVAWTFFFFAVGIIGFARWTARNHYNVWGSLLEDYWCAFAMWPFVCAQLEMAAANDNKDAPGYFDDLDRSLARSSVAVKSAV